MVAQHKPNSRREMRSGVGTDGARGHPGVTRRAERPIERAVGTSSLQRPSDKDTNGYQHRTAGPSRNTQTRLERFKHEHETNPQPSSTYFSPTFVHPSNFAHSASHSEYTYPPYDHRFDLPLFGFPPDIYGLSRRRRDKLRKSASQPWEKQSLDDFLTPFVALSSQNPFLYRVQHDASGTVYDKRHGFVARRFRRTVRGRSVPDDFYDEIEPPDIYHHIEEHTDDFEAPCISTTFSFAYACALARRWDRAGMKNVRIAVVDARGLARESLTNAAKGWPDSIRTQVILGREVLQRAFYDQNLRFGQTPINLRMVVHATEVAQEVFVYERIRAEFVLVMVPWKELEGRLPRWLCAFEPAGGKNNTGSLKLAPERPKWEWWCFGVRERFRRFVEGRRNGWGSAEREAIDLSGWMFSSLMERCFVKEDIGERKVAETDIETIVGLAIQMAIELASWPTKGVCEGDSGSFPEAGEVAEPPRPYRYVPRLLYWQGRDGSQSSSTKEPVLEETVPEAIKRVHTKVLEVVRERMRLWNIERAEESVRETLRCIREFQVDLANGKRKMYA